MRNVDNPLICYVSDERFPSRWTDTQQIMKTATALADEGARVDLVLPRRWGSVWKGRKARMAQLMAHYGVRPRFELTQILTVPAGASRIEKFTHGVVAPFYMLLRGHDVLYTRNVLPLCLALCLGRCVVFESHRNLKAHQPINYFFINLFRPMRRFLGVVSNARFISEAYEAMGFSPERIYLVHNAFDPRDMEPRLDKGEARRQIGMAGPEPIVCYAGHIQQRKGIDMVIDLAARLPETRFLVCGGFPEDVTNAERLAAERGAKNMRFTGWIDVAKLAPYLYAADVLLVPPARAPLERHGNTVLPIKTYTYLSAGRVIVAPRLPDVEEVLQDGENALLVTPDQPEEAVAAIRRALSDPALAERLGENARNRQFDFTWKARALRIRHFLSERLRLLRS